MIEGGAAATGSGGGSGEATADAAYAERLRRLEGASWKRYVDVQAPYRWNIRRLVTGPVLDVGCGLGRNLTHLDGNGVGVDHNPDAVAECRRRGLTAYTTTEFPLAPEARPGAFQHLLVAHVLEHLVPSAAEHLLRTYLPYVAPGGSLVVITPQEAGQRSDPTHVTFLDFATVRRLVKACGLRVTQQRSFPLPRPFGRVFRHNEFVTVARVPD